MKLTMRGKRVRFFALVLLSLAIGWALGTIWVPAHAQGRPTVLETGVYPNGFQASAAVVKGRFPCEEDEVLVGRGDYTPDGWSRWVCHSREHVPPCERRWQMKWFPFRGKEPKPGRAKAPVTPEIRAETSALITYLRELVAAMDGAFASDYLTVRRDFLVEVFDLGRELDLEVADPGVGIFTRPVIDSKSLRSVSRVRRALRAGAHGASVDWRCAP